MNFHNLNFALSLKAFSDLCSRFLRPFFQPPTCSRSREFRRRELEGRALLWDVQLGFRELRMKRRFILHVAIFLFVVTCTSRSADLLQLESSYLGEGVFEYTLSFPDTRFLQGVGPEILAGCTIP